MKITPTEIEDVLIIEPQVWTSESGDVESGIGKHVETARYHLPLLLTANFVHPNMEMSMGANLMTLGLQFFNQIPMPFQQTRSHTESDSDTVLDKDFIEEFEWEAAFSKGKTVEDFEEAFEEVEAALGC